MANDIEIRVRVANQTAAGITSVNQSMRQLRDTARDAGQALNALTARATAAAAALHALEEAAEGASRKLRTLRGRAAATADALRDMRTAASASATSIRTLDERTASANGRLSTLGDRTRSLRDDLDGLNDSSRRAGGGLNGLRGRLGTLTTASGNAQDSTRGLLAAAISLAPALVPIAAAAVPIATSMAAAGVAVGAFGAALIGQITAMGDAADAQKKYDEAVEKYGKSSKQAAEAERAFLAQVKGMPTATRRAAAGLSAMKDAYREWSDSLADDTMPVVTKGLGVLSGLFPKLTPLVRGTSRELDRFMTILAGGMQSRGFDRLMGQFSEFATSVLARANAGLVKFARSLDTGEIGGGYRSFMEYVRANGPLVRETLANLSRAVSNLLRAVADVGPGMLALVNAFAKLVAAVPTSLLTTLMQLVIAFKAVQMAAAGLAAVTGSAAVASLAAFVRTARFGGVGAAVTGLAQRMSVLQKAAVGLGVLTVVGLGISKLAEKARGAPPDVDRLAVSLRRLADAGKFSGELQKTFGDMDGLIAKARSLATETEKAQKTAFGIRIPGLDDAADWISGKINDMAKGSQSLAAIKEDFNGLDTAMGQLVASGYADQAASSFKSFQKALAEAGYSTKEINALFPQYRDAVANLKYEQELAAASMGLFGEQAIAVQSKLDAQKASADGLRQAIQALNDVNRAGLGGMIGFEAAIDAAAKAAKKNAGSLRMVNGELDLNHPKAQAAATALSDLGAKTDEAAASAREQGRSWNYVNGIYSRGREELIKSAQTMGLTRDQAKALADQILATPDKTARLKGNLEDLQQKVDAAKAKIKSVPPSKLSKLYGNLTDLQDKVARAKERLGSVPKSKRSDLKAHIGQLEAAIRRAKGQIASVRGKTVRVHVNTHYTVSGAVGRKYGSAGSQLKYAAGGPVGRAAAGGPRSNRVLVGEQGPELVDLAPGSMVHTAGDSRRLMQNNRGGGRTEPVVIELRSSGNRTDDMLLEILRRAIHVRGGDPSVVLRTNRRGG